MMAVNYYDTALLNKLKAWTNDTQLSITGPNETSRLFSLLADEGKDSKIKLPLISLSRKGGYRVVQTAKRPLSFDGMTLNSTVDKAMQLNAIPISIEYQLDVYTRYLQEADEYVRNIIFNTINYPNLQVVIPYRDVNYVHDSNVRLNPDIQDNSNIPERLIAGQFTRLSLSLYIDDAYLWDVRIRDNYFIDVDYVID